MSVNVLKYKHGRINLSTINSKFNLMEVYVDLRPYWPKGLSINAAYEELLLKGLKVDRRTLSAAKAGTLTKSEFITLVKLRDWIRQLTGKPEITIDDLLRIEN